MNLASQQPAYSTKKAALSPVSAISCESRLSGLRILLVDDSHHNQLLMSKILRLAGAEVGLANNGREAVELALSNSFDVILMDLQMPDLNGYQATKQLRCMGYEKPIIALTAHVLSQDREHCLKAGFNDHVGKPPNLESMVLCLQSYRDYGALLK